MPVCVKALNVLDVVMTMTTDAWVVCEKIMLLPLVCFHSLLSFTVEPRDKEPPSIEHPSITNNIFQPSNSKIMHLSMVCPRMGGGGATHGNLTS